MFSTDRKVTLVVSRGSGGLGASGVGFRGRVLAQQSKYSMDSWLILTPAVNLGEKYNGGHAASLQCAENSIDIWEGAQLNL